METKGAKVLWDPSIEKHNIRHKWMVSDGDSKAFNPEEDTYGDDCKVVKLDCAGHVQKGMGKHLLNLKATTKGKLADGHLSEGKIKQIQQYYGLPIRQNSLTAANPTDREVNMVVYSMKNIIAMLNHSVKAQDLSKQH